MDTLSKSDFDYIFDTVPEAIVVGRVKYDESGTPVDSFILDMNDSCEKLLGISGKEWINQCFSDLFSDPRVFLTDIIQEILKSGTPERIKTGSAAGNKEVFLRLLPLPDSRFIAVFYNNEGITVPGVSGLIESIAETSPVGITVVSGEGKIIFANRKAEEILGLSKNKIGQRTYNDPAWEIIGIDGYPIPDEELPFSVVMKTGNPVYDIRHGLALPNGDKIFLSINASPFRNNIGEITDVITIIQDITEKIKIDSVLKKMEWLLEKENIDQIRNGITYLPVYAAPSGTDPGGTISDSVDRKTLESLASEIMDLLESAVSIYDSNGNFIFGLFASGWCSLMNNSCCDFNIAENIQTALDSGSWFCHENRWKDSASVAVKTGRSSDIECVGGIRLYAEPIFAAGSIIGAINIGYSDPPQDEKKLAKLSSRFGIDVQTLKKEAMKYKSRPPYIIELAKKRLRSIAKIIGEIVTRKTVERDLKKRNDFIYTVLDKIAIGILVYSIKNRQTLFVNKELEKIYGWSADNLKDVLSIFNCLYPDVKDRDRMKKMILGGIDSGNPEDMHWEGLDITRQDGEQRIINAVNIPIFDQDTMVSTIMDVTEQKKAEKAIKEKNAELQKINRKLSKAKEKAEESDRLKTAFLANISHEIRTPMNGIMGFADLLKEPYLPGEEQQRYIEMIQQSGQRMLSIINDLINISRIETGHEDIITEEFSVDRLLEDIRIFFTPEAYTKGLDLILRRPGPDSNSILRADKTKLNQVISNLIKNALKFTSSGKIEFGYEERPDGIYFFVKDTGIGIPAGLHGKIFERFMRIEQGNMVATEGSGLGLSISKSYIEMMGGNISLESAPGKGSTFSFLIPFFRAH